MISRLNIFKRFYLDVYRDLSLHRKLLCHPKLQRRMKSFTLIELIVTMIISSIGIGIMGSAYRIVNHQYSSYKKMNEGISHIKQLNALLHKDFDNAMQVNWRNGTLEILNEKDEKEIIYKFNHNTITRLQANVNDVFEIKIIGIKGMLMDQPLTGIIDELQIEVLVNGANQHFHFKKQYGADVMMAMKEVYGN